MKVLKSYQEYKIEDYSCRGHVFIEDLQIRVSQTMGGIRIIDLEGALRVGKVCPEYSLSWWSCDGDAKFLNYMLQLGIEDIKGVYELLKAREFEKDKWGWYADQSVMVEQRDGKDERFTYSRDEKKGVQVFSPFAIKYLKPLKEAPKKMTVKHALRAIACGQFTDLRCAGKYTDDYAFDDAYDYQRGAIKAPLEFIKDIIDHPSGWWASLGQDGEVKLCCHHFDSNRFKLVIK